MSSIVCMRNTPLVDIGALVRCAAYITRFKRGCLRYINLVHITIPMKSANVDVNVLRCSGEKILLIVF